MRYLPGNAQHIGARHSQQDSFGFLDPEDKPFISHGGFLAVVCDGMGGMEHGDAASRTAVKAFLEAYQRKTPAESIPAALERAVRDANQHVVALAHSLGMSEGVGTTLVATALAGTSMYFISVGDSGIFHVSGGQMQTVNRPHIFANVLDQAVARGSMSREDAENHPERESLTSFIGSEKLEEIDHNQDPWPLQDGDTILLASDGMFKTLENEEILTCLQGNPQVWPDTLVTRTLAKEREYQDNVTVLSVTVESDARAAMPRTVVMMPPPAVAVGSASKISPPPMMAPIAPLAPMTAPMTPLAMTSPMAPLASPMALPPPPVPAPPPISPAIAALPPLPAQGPAPSRRGTMLLLILIVAAALAGGWWWRMKHAKPSALPPATPDRRVQAPATPDTSPEIPRPVDPAATDPDPKPLSRDKDKEEQAVPLRRDPVVLGEPVKPEKTAQPIRPIRPPDREKKQEHENR